MSNKKPGEIAVVKPYYAKEEAYRMGHERTSGWDDETAPDDAEHTLSHVKESARWANTIAPTLRCMAGYMDNGHGTYTGSREVAAIHDGCEEDEPAEAELFSSVYLYEELVEAWDRGALDGYDGEYNPEDL